MQERALMTGIFGDPRDGKSKRVLRPKLRKDNNKIIFYLR